MIRIQIQNSHFQVKVDAALLTFMNKTSKSWQEFCQFSSGLSADEINSED